MKAKEYYLLVPIKTGGNSSIGQNFHSGSGKVPEGSTLVTAANNLCYRKVAVSNKPVIIDSYDQLAQLVQGGIKGFSTEKISQTSLKNEDHWDMVAHSAGKQSGLNLLKEGKTTLLHWQSGGQVKEIWEAMNN